jgi:hypothetical protein
LATIRRFHQTFVERGLELKFQTTGRPPQSYYPTYRELLLQTDPDGRVGNFLGSEESYAVVRGMQLNDQIVPVVGNLAGSAALATIGKLMAARGEVLTALYASNVELYLFDRERAFGAFVANLEHLPRSDRSVIIRSVFGGFGRGFGAGSVSQLQRANELVDGYAVGRFRSYGELVAP